MTDFKLSQLTAATPAAADLIPFVDVDDTSTAPAGAGGSDKVTTVANLLAGAGVSLDSTAAHIQPDGVQAAGAQGLAADSAHVHPEKGAQSLLLAPAASGALAETMPRLFATAAISTSSGTTRAVAIALPKGLVVTNITFCTGNTAETGGSHGWYGLLDNTTKVLAVSADQAGATFWTSASAITLAMGSPYTVLAAGIFYIAVSVTATQVPNFTGFSYSAQQTINLSPILAATAGTHNAPPSVGTTLTLSSDNALYGYVS